MPAKRSDTSGAPGSAEARPARTIKKGQAMNRRFLIGSVALGVAAAAAAATEATAGVPLPVVEQVEGPASLAPMLEKVLPAVVSIEVKTRPPETARLAARNRREPRRPEVAAKGSETHIGSGVVIDEARGLIITNNHVIDRAAAMTVTLSDGRELAAKLVGADPVPDIAVISVAPEGLTAMPLGDSDRVRVGDFVLAIGNPSNIGESVTAGIASGLHRRRVGIERFEDFIQTDAAIYPGNSGGALANLSGELIGISTAYIGASNTNPGLGFAVPINVARKVANHLVVFGSAKRGKFGITYEVASPAAMRDVKLAAARNVPVMLKVEPGSAAERAGLKSGDVVTEIDGTSVQDAEDFGNRIGLLWNGDTAALSVLRGGRSMMIQVTMPDDDKHRGS
jgi:serine protease DegQ